MKKTLSRVLMWTGIALVALAVLLFAASRILIVRNEERARETVETLYELMPSVRDGAPDGRAETAMPVLELDGTDFAGILEIPAFGTVLPLCGTWDAGDVTKYPHRFTGSMYDGSLVIGGSDNPGQLDFMKAVSIGDTVYLTDAAGERYRYTVSWVEKTKDVSASHLCDADADLTLFARNTYGFEYTVVRCVLK